MLTEFSPESQRTLLQMLSGGSSLEAIFDTLARVIEERLPQARCSVALQNDLSSDQTRTAASQASRWSYPIHSPRTGKAVGRISVSLQDQQAALDDHQPLLEAAAQLAGLAYDREIVEQALAERERLARLATAVSRILTARLPLPEILHQCADALVRHLGVAFARIWLLNEHEQVLVLAASAGMYTNLHGSHSRVPVGTLKIGRMVQDRRPCLTNHVLQENWVTDKDWAKREGMVAFAGYPLIAEDRVVGVMAMFARHALSERILEELGVIAGGIAQCVVRSQAEARMHETVHHLGQRVKELEALHTVSNLLQQDYEIGQLLERLAALLPGAWQYPEVAASRIVLNGREIKTPHFRLTPWSQRTEFCLIDGTPVCLEVVYLEERPFLAEERKLLNSLAELLRSHLERKHAEAALRSSEERFRFLAESIPHLVWAARPDGYVDYYNRRCFEFTGASPEELQGWGWSAVLHPDDLPQAVEVWKQSLASGREHRTAFRIRRASDGTYRWHQAHALPLRDPQGRIVRWFGTCTDIHDLAEAQAELRLREQEYRAMFELAGVGKVQVDPRIGRFLKVNRKFCEMTGYAPEELLEKSFVDITHPEDRARNVEGLKQLASGAISEYSAEKRYLRKDGSVIWAHLNVVMVRDSDGAPVRTIGVVQDITARKQAEAALRESEQSFRRMAEAIPQVVFVADLDGLPRYVNRRWFEYGDAGSEHRLSRLWEHGVHPDDRLRLFELWLKAVRTSSPFECECRVRRSDGSYRWLLWRAVPVVGSRGISWFGSATDINDLKVAQEEVSHLLKEAETRECELREKQEQLIQAGKLSTLGEMATGIAHELNNPLNNVALFLGNVIELLDRGRLPRKKILQDLRMSLQQVWKAAAIISHLRTFGRSSPSQQEPVNLHTVLNDALSLMHEQFRLREVRLKLDLCAQAPVILGNPIQLEQVFLNLLTNARDALEQSENRTIWIQTRLQSHTVVTVVEDSGPGIPPGYENRIFDPFFSTKDVGKGTGLGLSITYSIIKAHQGTITAENSPEAGARFIIRLPLHAGPAPQSACNPP